MKKLLIALSMTVAALGMSTIAEAAAKTKVCFIYLGSKTDGGWTQGHEGGRLALEKALGDKVETVALENVPEGPDSERSI